MWACVLVVIAATGRIVRTPCSGGLAARAVEGAEVAVRETVRNALAVALYDMQSVS